jgi:hypothetical protein
MVADNNVPPPKPPRALGSSDVPRLSGPPKVYSPTDESASRMDDEGCPNDSPSVADATGYSREEEDP